MTPTPAQLQRLLPTPPPSPNIPSTSGAPQPPASPRPLLLYLAGGLILLTIITTVSLKIAPSLLRQETLPPNFQNQPIAPTSSNKTADMSSWKEYADSQIGYSLKYPPQITIQDNRNESGEGYIFLTLPDYQSLTIQHLDNPRGLSPEDFYLQLTETTGAEHKKNNLPPVLPPIKTNPVTINEVQGFQFLNSAGDGNILHTYFGKENTIIDISFYNDDNNPNHNQEDVRLFRQILSTFKFITYPIYPNAVFIRNEDAPSCEDAPARGECGQTASVWQTPDSRDKVVNWYKSNHYGWKFESLNDQASSNNPIFGYLKNETSLLYVELYKNGNIATIKIFNQS